MPKPPSLSEMKPLQGERTFANHIRASMARIGTPSPNQGIPIACHNNHHVHVTLRVTPSASSYPTLSAHAELMRTFDYIV